MTTQNPSNSGAGSRPVTDGAVDNIGAADTFTPDRPGDNTPAPRERTPQGPADATSVKSDDSAPLGMTDAAHDVPNTEAPTTARDNVENP